MGEGEILPEVSSRGLHAGIPMREMPSTYATAGSSGSYWLLCMPRGYGREPCEDLC